MSFPVPGIGNVFLRSVAVNVPLVGAIVAGVVGVYSFLKWERTHAGVDKEAQRKEFLRRLCAESDIPGATLVAYLDCADPIAKAIDTLRRPRATETDTVTPEELTGLRRALSGAIV